MDTPVKRSVLVKNAHLDAGWLELLFVNFLYQLGITKWDPRQNRLSDVEYQSSKDLLLPGDIVLVGQYRRLSSLFIRGVFTHALVYVGDGVCIHVDGLGVREITYKSLFAEFDTLALVRVPGITTKQQQQVVESMRAHLGEPFDYWFDATDTRAWFCSELICSALKEAEIDKEMCQTHTSRPHPSDFYVADMKVVYTSHCLRVKEGKVVLCHPVKEKWHAY